MNQKSWYLNSTQETCIQWPTVNNLPWLIRLFFRNLLLLKLFLSTLRTQNDPPCPDLQRGFDRIFCTEQNQVKFWNPSSNSNDTLESSETGTDFSFDFHFPKCLVSISATFYKHFLYKIVLCSFSLITVCFCNFLVKEYWRKSCS